MSCSHTGPLADCRHEQNKPSPDPWRTNQRGLAFPQSAMSDVRPYCRHQSDGLVPRQPSQKGWCDGLADRLSGLQGKRPLRAKSGIPSHALGTEWLALRQNIRPARRVCRWQTGVARCELSALALRDRFILAASWSLPTISGIIPIRL